MWAVAVGRSRFVVELKPDSVSSMVGDFQTLTVLSERSWLKRWNTGEGWRGAEGTSSPAMPGAWTPVLGDGFKQKSNHHSLSSPDTSQPAL